MQLQAIILAKLALKIYDVPARRRGFNKKNIFIQDKWYSRVRNHAYQNKFECEHHAFEQGESMLRLKKCFGKFNL